MSSCPSGYRTPMFYSEEASRVIGTTKDLRAAGSFLQLTCPTLRCFAMLQHDKWCGLFHAGFSNNAKTLLDTRNPWIPGR